MESLGAYLRAQREVRELSLDGLLRETRIPRYVGEALEEDRYKDLPAPVFTRGFIRAYLRHLGLPPDEALALFQAGIAPPAPSSPPTEPATDLRRRYLPIAVCLASGTVLSIGLYAYVVLTRPVMVPLPPKPLTAQVPAAPPLEAPGEKAPAPETEAAPLRLVVRATEPTWVRVETDEGEPIQELLPVSAVREWSAQSRFVLTVGNAGGIMLELNGKPLPPLGRSGEVVRDLVLRQATLEAEAGTDAARR